jgi:hypothetical protein
MKIDFEHYFICADCAKEKGGVWPKGHQATCHMGECGYCKKPKALAAWSDYSWPKNTKADRAADKTREL